LLPCVGGNVLFCHGLSGVNRPNDNRTIDISIILSRKLSDYFEVRSGDVGDAGVMTNS